MEIIKTTKKDFLDFLKSIYVPGAIEGAIIHVGKKFVKAVGVSNTETLFFRVNHKPIEIFNTQEISISDLKEFIKFVDRANTTFILKIEDNKVIFKGVKTITNLEEIKADSKVKPIFSKEKNKTIKMTMNVTDNTGIDEVGNKSFNIKEMSFFDGDNTFEFDINDRKDISDLPFAEVLRDTRLISGLSSPKLTFKEKKLVIEHLETGYSIEIETTAFFNRNITLNSGELLPILSSKPKSMMILPEKKGNDVWLIITNNANFYVMAGFSIMTGDTEELPF